MLEGDEKSNWYLWGFSNDKGSYFEAHDTHSESVAADIRCEFLIGDVFSGNSIAVTISNIYPQEKSLSEIKNLFCNAHARRNFNDSIQSIFRKSTLYLCCYGKINQLEKDKDVKDRRRRQRLYYKVIILKQELSGESD